MDRIRGLIASVREVYDDLSPRDRKLFTGFIAVVYLLIGGVVTWQALGVLEGMESRVVTARSNLDDVRELSARYQLLHTRIDAAEARMSEFRANQMNTYLEGWATAAGVADTLQVRPGTPQSVGDYQALPYEVKVGKADLGGLFTFLYRLESSPYPIRIRAATVRAADRREGRELSVDLDVVAYTKEGDE